MNDIENAIKDQYARFLETGDWRTFKHTAEYYIKSAAKLKKENIAAHKRIKLRIRNSLKRLYLGIGCELLLKAFYLKKGYCINKPGDKTGIKAEPTYKLIAIDRTRFNHRDTYTMGPLINKLKFIHQFQNYGEIEKAFKIAMVFRNKEGHVTLPTHKFDPKTYADIERGLVEFYKEAFGQKLTLKIAMKQSDIAKFKVENAL